MEEKQILHILLDMQQELKAQHEELKSQHEELKSQSEELKSQREELKSFRKEVNGRLDNVEQQLADLKEDAKITRAATNQLLAWAEEVQTQVSIPLYKKA